MSCVRALQRLVAILVMTIVLSMTSNAVFADGNSLFEAGTVNADGSWTWYDLTYSKVYDYTGGGWEIYIPVGSTLTFTPTEPNWGYLEDFDIYLYINTVTGSDETADIQKVELGKSVSHTFTEEGIYKGMSGAIYGNSGDDILGFTVNVSKDNPGVSAPTAIMPMTSEIKVTLNGTAIEFDQPPVIESGRTLVPLRAIFEALGAVVDWNQATQTVTATKDNVKVSLQIGNNILVKNGESITLDVPAKIVGGRTLVPARAVAESFEATVNWDSDTQTVIIIAP